MRWPGHRCACSRTACRPACSLRPAEVAAERNPRLPAAAVACTHLRQRVAAVAARTRLRRRAAEVAASNLRPTAAAEEAVRNLRLTAAGGEGAAAWTLHRTEGAGAVGPTFVSSYEAGSRLSEPNSKLRKTHAWTDSAYAAVNRIPIPQAIAPSELMKPAAISIRPAIRVLVGFSKQRRTTPRTARPPAMPPLSTASTMAGVAKLSARPPIVVTPNASTLRKRDRTISPVFPVPRPWEIAISSAGR